MTSEDRLCMGVDEEKPISFLFLCNNEFHTRIFSSRDTGRVPYVPYRSLKKDPTSLVQWRAEILKYPHLLPYKSISPTS